MENKNNTHKGHQLRTGRLSETNRVYLITSVTHQRELLFKDLYIARIVVRSMKHLHENGSINSLAYVVMPDHIHWLLQLNEHQKISRIMNKLKSHSALMINRYNGVSNKKVWQAGYHDRALRKEQDIKNIARYIVANPLRAGLVTDIGEYSLWDAVWL